MKIYSISVFIILNIFLKNSTCENLKLLILHNNDMHSRFEETSRTSGTCKDKANCYGGFARVLHVIREARKAAADGTGPPVLYLNAGDTYTGTSWFSVHKWKIAADFMNLLHPDVASLGNNEFGYTPLGLEPFLRSATYPIVVANVDFAKDSVLNTSIKQSHTIEISGIKIGVIGYLTPSTFLNVYYDNVTVVDEISAIKAESERLHKEGVKTIIALGHSGYEMDKKIAEKVPLVDLVVGAHSHTFLWRGIKPDIEEPKGLYPTVIVQSSGKKVLVVQAFAKTKYMGRLTVVINTQGEIINCTGIPQLLNASVPQDEDAISLLETFRERLTIFNNTIVGTSRVVLNGSLKLCQYNECNLPNLVTDAFVSYYLSVYGRKTIAMISARSLQNNIEPLANGSISMLALINALPYNGLIWSVTLKGEDLLKTLENGVRNDHDGRHREFIYSSGITYIFNESLPVGLRIVNAKIGCHVCKSQNFRDIQPNNSYRVTTTELLYLGFDQHKIISESGWDKVQESKRELDIVSRYISRMSPIDIDVVGRIQKIN